MSPHKLLQDKVTAFGKAVRHGDEATALQLLGDVAREAEARGVARCAAEARQHADQTRRRAGAGAAPGDAAKLADLFDGWAGTTRQAAPAFLGPKSIPEEAVASATAALPAEGEGQPAGEAPPPEEEEAGAEEDTAADEEEAAEEEERPKRRRKGKP